MGGSSDSEGSGFNWNTDDEEETQSIAFSSLSNPRTNNGDAFAHFGEASSSAGPSCSKSVSHFVGMGFSKEMVIKAIEENGEGNTEAIVESLLSYQISGLHHQIMDEVYGLDSSEALGQSPPGSKSVKSDLSSESPSDFLDEFSDMDSDFENEENINPLSEREKRLKFLVDMGYPIEEASIAMDRCGPDAPITEVTDFICAAQMAREADVHLEEPPRYQNFDGYERNPYHLYGGPCDPARDKKRKFFEDEERWKRKRDRGCQKKLIDEDDDTTHLPNPMVGFGLPGEPMLRRRTLPEAAMGCPFFYYENVALAPKGVWATISRFLYEIEPEFVDSQFFSAAARKRGYIHNLPIHNRFPLLPLPPQTIFEAFPLTKQWWPSWDRRTKLNCVQTCTASAKLTERIRDALRDWDGEPPMRVQKYVINECRKWNLVWVGPNKTAPLEPDEIETLLGFPKNHTRGGGISRTERLKGLGNSFQVDTVAYHLSVLKDMFPGGITVLSLFSGIGGAEVALHRLGIPLKNVVSVEISETSRNILRGWWESTNQQGRLIDIADVGQLDAQRLEQLISSIGGFDLIIGGSPCNNISGSNRVSRDGLEGKHSSLFYDYFRILNQVKDIMGKS